MKEQDLIEKLRKLKREHIELFDPERKINRTAGLAANYWDLMVLIGDFLKTSKIAIEGIQVAEEKYLEDAEINIGQVIGVVLHLLPYSEMQFVDKVLQLLAEVEES